jgi:chorismate synthase
MTMAGNSFGKLFKITTCGESHGGVVAVIVDGCPPGLMLAEDDIQKELDRRKPGQSSLTTSRNEKDVIRILSGVFEGKTTGTPILLQAHNNDMRPEDYETLKNLYRPSHADYTYTLKYGLRDYRGSGRASARETLARVAAGAIAKKYLKEKLNIDIFSYVEQVGAIKTTLHHDAMTAESVDTNIVRCPDQIVAQQMIELINQIRAEGDSIGGIIRGVIRNVPGGLGEPVFDKLSADLAKAMLSINAAKGFDFGTGFSCVDMRGSEHNDLFTLHNGKISFQSNHAGCILGGISSGENIYFRVVFKPVSTIGKNQKTIDINHGLIDYVAVGRHDPCVLPRAVPIVDAMSALVIMDHYLRNKIFDRASSD